MFVEVLVVGGGPAGSAAAAWLAGWGREVLLVDRARFPRPKPCGEYLSPRCHALLGELGLRGALYAGGLHPHRRLVLRAPDGFALVVSLAELAPPGATAFALPRVILDALLLEQARARGARVWEGASVRQIERGAGGEIQALVATEDETRWVRARLVVAADGARSLVARRLGLACRAPGRRRFGLVARYGDVAHAAPDAVEMHACPPGYCGFALEAGGEANLGMVVDESELRHIGGDPSGYFEATLPRFSHLAAQLRGARRLGKVATVGPIASATRRQSAPGVLLVGDAAGFQDPFTGQGVTFALETARLAAAVAEAALGEEDLSARRLAAYDRARAALLGPRLRVQRAIQQFIARPAWFSAALRRLDARPELARQLIAVTADLAPARMVLSPCYLARLVYP
jgi:flavin-dependent dehydrogenase